MSTTPRPAAVRRKGEKSAPATDDRDVSDSVTLQRTSSSLQSYLYAALMGLLTSSCCIIQLVLNAFSIGCAGFSVLTPFRPVFLSLSISMIIYNIVKYGRSRPLQTLITILIVTTLSLSPELVAHKNHGGHLMPSSTWWSSLSSVSSWGVQLTLWSSLSSTSKRQPATENGACVADPPSASPSILDTLLDHSAQANVKAPKAASDDDLSKGSPLNVYKVRVEGMKCEACANRLQSAFLAQPGVKKCTVHFQDKHLYLWTLSPSSSSSSSEDSGWTESQIKHVIATVDFKYRASLLAQGSVESADETL
ncbi:hypothetical protein DFQ27_003071 [Actinomortierella ambigua]|uniref:HMA domain-containing protein n=1 Tax=Actinomortierella ambigua TaxID=1343610 RepID=A0A9P6Q5S1_9FUNG|nr:hypothetical protein DFQ27_003071 [Actinomortierella ambigua]